MKFLASVVLLAVLAATHAAPAAENPAQKEFQAELEKAIKPIQSELRGLYDSAKIAAQDLTKSFAEASNHVMEAGKSLLAPSESTDRANLPGELAHRLRSLGKKIEEETRSLLTKANNDLRSVIAQERGAMFGVRDAINMLERKYLTQDGQDALKMVMRTLGVLDN